MQLLLCTDHMLLGRRYDIVVWVTEKGEEEDKR